MKTAKDIEMTGGQFARINCDLFSTDRAFVAACHKRLAPLGKSRAQRIARHAWIRSGFELRDSHIALIVKFRL